MKFTVIVFVLLASLCLLAEAKSKRKRKNVTPAETKHKIPVHAFGFRVPAFAIRMPFFGGLPFLGQQLHKKMKGKMSGKFHDFNGKMPKLKTKTQSKNSTHGPFKTYTVTTETVSDNPKNKSGTPQIFEKVIKSVTTLDKNSSSGNSSFGLKTPRIQATEFIFRPFGLLGAGKLDDEGEKLQDCTEKKPCKDTASMYCDAFFGVCKKKVIAGYACTQKDQCASSKGDYLCTWGRCVKNADGLGSAGTFCDEESQCHAAGDEELGCFRQPDISRFSKVCVPKLGEGATCGRFGIFDVFERDDELSSRCKKDLACRAIGFFGRKACIRDIATTPEIEDEDNKDEKQKSDSKPAKQRKH